MQTTLIDELIPVSVARTIDATPVLTDKEYEAEIRRMEAEDWAAAQQSLTVFEPTQWLSMQEHYAYQETRRIGVAA